MMKEFDRELVGDMTEEDAPKESRLNNLLERLESVAHSAGKVSIFANRLEEKFNGSKCEASGPVNKKEPSNSFWERADRLLESIQGSLDNIFEVIESID